jgi:hypothetical protein
MSEQNFSNHKRFHPAYHFFMLPLTLVGLIASAYHWYKSDAPNSYIHLLIFMAFVILFSVAAFVRVYALKAQDRAIKAEEALRHYILTGKPMDARLRMGQIIALRFASDNELPELASRAVNENLRSLEIKKAIKEWRADYYRV